MATNKKLDDLLRLTAQVAPASERRVTPDLKAPPTTGVGLVTERGNLMQKNKELEAEVAALRTKVDELLAGVASGEALQVSVDLLDPNPWQPRKKIDPASLVGSVGEQGVMQPVVVRSSPDKPGRYQIIAGERRTRAAKVAGLATVPIRLLELEDAEMALFAFQENRNREDLTDYEQGCSLAGMLQGKYGEVTKLAKVTSMHRTELRRYLAFKDLPDFIIQDLDDNPSLMGRGLAEELVSYSKQATNPLFLEKLAECWSIFKEGKVAQNKFLALLEKLLTGESRPSAVGVVQKTPITSGGKKVGDIKKDGRKFVVSLNTPALTDAQESQIRDFLGKLFK